MGDVTMTKEDAYQVAVGLAAGGRNLDILMKDFSAWVEESGLEQAAANLALWGTEHSTKGEVLLVLLAAVARLHEGRGTVTSEHRLVRTGQRAGEQVPHRTLFIKSPSRQVVEDYLMEVAPFDGDPGTESWWIEHVQISEKVLDAEEATPESVLASRQQPLAL